MNGESTTLAQRIQICAKRAGNASRFARETEVSRTTMDSYLKGITEPKASTLAAMARVAGVSLEWLITGRDAGHSPHAEVPPAAPAPSAPSVDPKLMGYIVDAIRSLYKAEGAAIPDRTLGEEAARIYSELATVQHDMPATLIALGEILADRRRRLRESAENPGQSKRPA